VTEGEAFVPLELSDEELEIVHKAFTYLGFKFRDEQEAGRLSSVEDRLWEKMTQIKYRIEEAGADV
jgi:hypothetical protein